MKKPLIAAASAMMLWACSSEEPAMKTIAEQESKTISCLRTPEEAIAIAKNLAASAANSARSTSKKVDASSLKVIGANTSRSNADTLIYAIDYADNAGFVLISAEKTTTPVLAFIDEGNYSDAASVGNEGYNYFVESAKSFVSDSRVEIAPGRDDLIMARYKDTIYTHEVNKPLLEVNWNQNWPENMFCPNKIAGCVPVAVAQIMSYLKPNIDINLSFSERPYDHLTIDWTELNKHVNSLPIKNPGETVISSHLTDCNSTEDNHTKLAALIRQIGHEAKATYNEYSTGAYPDYAVDILNKYTKTKGVYAAPSGFHGNLGANSIGIIFGYTSSGSGHAWVADGSALFATSYITYYGYNPITKEYESKDVKSESSTYIHYNWGWGGSCNGYFLENVFDTTKGSTFDEIYPFSRADYGTNTFGYFYRNN